jgi:CrcB protein
MAAALGTLGCVVRFVVDGMARARWSSDAPFGTIMVNVVGSFVFGLLAGLATRDPQAATAAVIVGTGFCGGLTTFSAISFETTRLAQARRWSLAISVPLITALLSLFVALAGTWLGSLG